MPTDTLSAVSSNGRGLSQLAPLRSRALVDEVYDLLLDMLTSGGLAADAPLGIETLARQMKISPTPIREALARLEHTGLIRREANRGYRVAPPLSVEQMTELIDARLVFERGALERAMREPAELLPDLENAFTQHEAATAALEEPGAVRDHDKVHNYYASDWAFHQAILNHAHNRYIDRAVNSLSFSFHRMRQTTSMGTTDAPVALAEHGRILKAVRDEDPAAALAALNAHLGNLTTRATTPELSVTPDV